MAEYASAIAGLISLGLTVCNGIIRYYSSFKDKDATCQSMLESVGELTKTLTLISSRLNNQSLASDVRQRVLTSMIACEDAITRLQKKLAKLHGPDQASESAFVRVRRKSLYPFKESTLIKMKEICDDCRETLQTALDLLHIDIGLTTLSQLDDLKMQVVEIADGVRDLRGEIQHNANGVATLVLRSRDEDLARAIDWLSPLHGVFQRRQQQHFSTNGRQDRSGKALLEDKKFEKWLSQPGRILWGVGEPGVGKTVTASFIVDHLQHVNNVNNVAVAYVYCSYKNQSQETASNIIANILQQLLAQSSADAVALMECFKKHSKQHTRPALNEITDLLLLTLRQFGRAYVVVDALDECSDVDENREIFVSELTNLLPHVNLFFVSRPLPHLEKRLDHSERYELRADTQDIIEYVKARMALSQRMNSHIKGDAALAQTIVSRIVAKVKGMFLMARLYLDSLITLNTKRKVKQALDVLPEGLTHVYEEALRRIQDQSPEDASLALRTLYWVFHSRRPLTIKELQCALAVEAGDKEFVEDGEPDGDLIISVCAGMALVEKETNTISLVHYTAREFFQYSAPHFLADGSIDLARTCVTYLLFSDFAASPYSHDEILEQTLTDHALLDYAARFWSVHTRDASGKFNDEEFALILQLLRKEQRLQLICQIKETPHLRLPGYSQLYTTGFSGLSFAASLGLSEFVSALLRNGEIGALEMRDSEGRTALHHAIAYGGQTARADVGSSNTFNRTISWKATSDLALQMTKDLLGAGANISQPDKTGSLPLHYAAAHNRVTIIQYLVNHGGNALLSSKDGYSGTPLYRAAEAGQSEAVQILLDHGCDVRVQNAYLQTALHRAAEENHISIVRLLIQHVEKNDGPDALRQYVGMKDHYGYNAMYRAADHGHKDVARLLLEAAKRPK